MSSEMLLRIARGEEVLEQDGRQQGISRGALKDTAGGPVFSGDKPRERGS
jgi:hypothetical protein